MAVMDDMLTTDALATMNRLEKGDEGVVFSVPDVRLLASLGIRLGKRVRVLARSFASGPVIVDVGSRSVVVDRALAAQITIRK